MGSSPSKPRVIPTKAKTVTIPTIPQDVIDEILDYLAAGSDFTSLRSCALVSKSWVPSCQRHLFHTVHFTPGVTLGWSNTFRVPEESPAPYVKDLHVSNGGSDHLFSKYTPWFTNVERMTWLGDGGWTLTGWRLPRSISSLTIETDTSTLLQVRNIMAQLPNLDNLSLSGDLVPVDRKKLVWIGATLKGRFGGRLRLTRGYAGRDTLNMLLEIPTGLRFTEVDICGMHGCLLSTMRLAEVCRTTLVKLSYEASTLSHNREALEHPFDFSKFPNLQEVEFVVGWMGGSLIWIPKALSTIKPATSPRLSYIRLSFILPPSANHSINTLIKDAGDDLRRVADESDRIEREFGDAVYFSLDWDRSFQVALMHLYRER